jgi:hypothetical protein
MFEVLAGEKINIQMISTSEIKVSCVIQADATERAVRALHTAFGLDAPAAGKPRVSEAAALRPVVKPAATPVRAPKRKVAVRKAPARAGSKAPGRKR